jgi:hypothetical protein
MSVKPTNIYAYLYSCCVLLFIIVSLLTCNTIKTPQHNSNFIDDAPKWLAQSNRVQMLGYKIFTDNNIFYHNLSIHIDNKEVYHNPNALFSTYYDILPIIRELKTDNIEVLIAYADDVNYHLKILRLLFHQHALIKQDTLPLFNGSHTDTDQDGYVEFSGFLSPNKPYCIGCDSV